MSSNQGTLKIFLIAVPIAVIAAVMITGPFRETLQSNPQLIFAPLGVIFFGIMGISLWSTFKSSSAKNLNIITHFTSRNGWSPDLITDVFTMVPKHLEFLTSPTYHPVQRRQHVAKRQGPHGKEYLGYLEFSLEQTDPRIRGGMNNAFTAIRAGASHILTVVSGELPGIVPGWVKMAPAWSQPDLISDIELESHEFNRQVYLRAEPERLATYFASPNLMDWYLQQEKKPFLHAEKKYISLLWSGSVTYDDLDNMTRQLREVVTLIQRSGALEK